MKARRTVPNVDGAITRCDSTAAVEPDAHVGVIDVAGAGDHRVDQRQHLAARASAADPADQAHRRVDQCLKPEPLRQRGDEQQTGVGDQVRLVEDEVDAVQTMGYSRHWKCLLAW